MYKPLFDAIVAGKPVWGISATNDALAEGRDPHLLVEESMIPAMEEIGSRFEREEVFVPELLMAAQTMKKSLELLKSHMMVDSFHSSGRIVIGTVKGDLHDIGKNLVASMLEGCGFDVVNLGTNVTAEKFVEAVQEHKANILGMSALLTTTMPYMKEVIDALSLAGVRSSIKIIVGGAPLTPDFARLIGADAFSSNANDAVAVARSLI